MDPGPAVGVSASFRRGTQTSPVLRRECERAKRRSVRQVAADDAGELRRSLDVVGSTSAASAELPPLNSEAHEGAET